MKIRRHLLFDKNVRIKAFSFTSPPRCAGAHVRISRPDMMYLFFLCLLGCGIPALSHSGLLDLAQAVEAPTLFSKDAWVHAERADDGNQQILVRDPTGKPIVVRSRTSELVLVSPRDQVFGDRIKQILVRGQTGNPIVVRDASPPDQVFKYQVDAHFLSHGGPFNLVSSEYGSSNEPSSTNLEATNGKRVEDTQDDRQDIGPSRPTRSPPGTQDGLSQVTQESLSQVTQDGLSQANIQAYSHTGTLKNDREEFGSLRSTSLFAGAQDSLFQAGSTSCLSHGGPTP